MEPTARRPSDAFDCSGPCALTAMPPIRRPLSPLGEGSSATPGFPDSEAAQDVTTFPNAGVRETAATFPGPSPATVLRADRCP